MGNRPIPTALKLLKGNPGRRKLPKREPKPKRLIPSPPAHLSAAALAAWGSLAARLDRLGLLTELDAFALEQLCENYAEIVGLRADIAAHGRLQDVETKAGGVMQRVRPSATLLDAAERRFRLMMVEFGLTPSSRSKVTVTPDDDSHADPAAAYF